MDKPICEGALPHSYAGFVSRTVAFVIDAVVMSMAILLVVALAQSTLGFFTLYGVVGRSVAVSEPVRVVVDAVIAVIGVALAVGYPVSCWVLFGQTLGKALTGIRVVRMDDKRLTIRCAVLRYAGYWLSALPLFLGFLWVLGEPERRAWHDKLAGTCVIYTFQPPAIPARSLPPAAA